MSRPFVNSIVFTDEGYKDSVEMWDDVRATIQVLIRQGYKCEVYEDDTDIIVINFEYADDGMGGPYLMWLTDDEVEMVQNFRDNEEEKSTN